jgi:hypothetical protein
MNLLLHCGAHHVERDDVRTAKTPDRTDTWVPIGHGRLLSLVKETLIGNAMTIVEEAHALTRDGNRYFGLLHVQNGNPSDKYGLVVGVRNSHDKSFSAGLALGASVFCCDNLSFSSEVVLARKHTVFIERDLPGIVQRGVGQLNDQRQLQDKRINCYQATDITDEQAHDVMVRAVDSQAIPVTRLPVMLREWRRPSHEEFAGQGKTGWRLFNAATEALKGRNLDALPKRTQALHGLLDSACSLNAAASLN